jgi:type IV pilus assembly protein PilO
MVDFSELGEIDVGDLSSWPNWFRWLMVVLVSGGLLWGGYKYFIEPEQNTLAKLERKENQLKKVYLDKKELVVNLPAYKEQMVEIRDRFGVVLRQLPDKTEVPALLIDISQAGLSRGLRFSQFKPGNPRREEFYITLPVSVTVSGRFHQLAEFISDLAGLPRIVTLGNMKIWRQQGRTLTMQALLYTYQYLEESDVKQQNKKIRVGG